MILIVPPQLTSHCFQLSSAEELFLGDDKHSKNSRCQAVDAGNDEYVIEAELHECGSKLSISDDDVIYSNKLIYMPAFSHHGITRMTEAVVPVACHYKRTHIVSSNAQHQPLTFSKRAKFSAGNSAFSLKLMTDDWSREMFSSTFHLGDLLHLEASYTGPDQRRVFIDSCVATLTPDPTSVPRYYFIENHGCLTDAKEGGSKARFQPRSRANSLQFQLDAFLFRNDLRNTVFLTCELKAIPKIWRNSLINKACNYIHSRWNNVDGNDGVCQCCDGFCHKRPHMDDMICDIVTLGPLKIFPRK
ncbi:zona pellucida sperm-binding protein 3-like isoform X2 [Melanotaenia boesemani]|uniref:zona pellucida sperm-binding protein 3-like isoform X2 n=1 Tax=Melanotaenia boesemani TaxID=1250792 RepID=UPI001C03CC87|nr:zona pellucida sperm-binding protein 3-like isoform X2 [Melanotaenia boesemani]